MVPDASAATERCMTPVSASTLSLNRLNLGRPVVAPVAALTSLRMALETTIVPRSPYSLALSARAKSDATRSFRDGVLTMVFEADGRPACARIWQRRDESLAVRIDGSRAKSALEHLRFVLAADDDHLPFLRRFARDPLLGQALPRLYGLRPLRVATVTHALVKAVCG